MEETYVKYAEKVEEDSLTDDEKLEALEEAVVEEDKVAYFVIGAESSGTKLATKLLMNAGVFGTDEHQQFFDKALDGDETRLERYLEGERHVVVRRSWPHGGEAPDVKKIYDALEKRGFEVVFVVTMRSWPTMIESQIEMEQHAPTRTKALDNITDAYLKIFYWIKRLKTRFIIVSYGDMLRNKTVTLHWMLTQLGLQYQHGMEGIIDHTRENVRVNDYKTGVMS